MSFENNFEYQEFEFENSTIQTLCQFLEIDSKIIKQQFSHLYYIKGFGVSTSKTLISHNLVLIELKDEELVPTQFFYDFLLKNTQNILEISTIKWVNEFLYNKDIPIEHAFKGLKVERLKGYILMFERKIIGVGRSDNNSKFMLNISNISSFLFEE